VLMEVFFRIFEEKYVFSRGGGVVCLKRLRFELHVGFWC